VNDEEFLRQLQEAFAVEAEEHLQAIAAGLLSLESAPAAPRRELVERIFREAHSLKGAAAAANRREMETVCQAMEGVFDRCKRGEMSLEAGSFDVLNGALNFLSELRTHGLPRAQDASGVQEWAHRLTALDARSAGREPPAHVAPVSVDESPVPLAAHAGAAGESPAPLPEKAETIRVPVQKVDRLLVQAEEMVRVKLVAAEHSMEMRELGSGLDEWRKEWTKVRAGSAATATLGRTAPSSKIRDFLDWSAQHLSLLEKRLGSLTRNAERNERSIGFMVDEILADAKRLAMQPFAQLLESLPRLVRQLSREQGKEVALVIRGSEVDIDKRILEEMKDPLLHLVRNAIDHGLERPEVRRERGKGATGSLAISISQREGNEIEFMMTDDGAGLDLAKLKAAAVRTGTLTEEQAGGLSEAAAHALVFESGLSTSPILTEISGRGLGMAIVQEKVTKLGGRIAVETTRHVGTTWRITLPVTLATFRGILVQSGGQTFVLPTLAVERIQRVNLEQIATIENRETISVQGRSIAFTWLADVLELPRVALPANQKYVETLVVGAGDQRVAFAVYSVLNEQEVLVKKLSQPLRRVRNVTGATILGSGVPAIILNTADLIESAIRLAAAGGRNIPAARVEPQAERVRELLVADDSVTSRMLLKNILESAGYRVTTAVDGIEALTLLKSRTFDLIVSDVEMPRMDGFDLTAKVRGDAKMAELPVVLVTALGSREDRERGIDVGASAYIVKSSFDQSNLLAIVRQLI
jgi:two-component system chemotaxis sensor kinase CheA